jgi:hypothetical protein
MKEPWRSQLPPPQRGLATYLGKAEAGHQWGIDSQTYTGSVSTVGGGTPQVGRTYPAWANQPDSRSQWVALVKPGAQKILPKEFAVEMERWTHFMRDAGRGGRAPWTETTLRRYLEMLEWTDSGEAAAVRVWDDDIYIGTFGPAIIARVAMGSRWTLGTAPELYYPPAVFSDWVLDSEGGDFYLLSGYITKVSKDPMTTLWSTSSFSGTGSTQIVRRSLALLGSSICAMVAHSRKLHLYAYNRDTGASLSVAELEQTPEPPFVAEEVVPLISNGSINKPYYWTPGVDPGIRWGTPGSGYPANTIGHPWAAVLTPQVYFGGYVYPSNPSGTINLASLATSTPIWGGVTPPNVDAW